MALDHGAHDAAIAPGDLAGDVPAHVHLLLWLLAAVGVAEVDHEARAQPGVVHLLRRHVDALGVVVRPGTPAQNHMGIRVAGGGEDGGAAFLGDRQKMMGMGRRVHGIQGDAQAAAGGVLEAHGTGQPRRQLAMALTLGGAGADGPPADEVGDVLGADEVEELGPRRYAQAIDVHEQGTGQFEALVDLETAIQVGVVDETLPAHRGARLLEIDAHDNQQLFVEAVADRQESLGVIPGRVDVMHRTGPHHRQQAVVLVVENVANGVPGMVDGGGDGVRQGVEPDQVLRRYQLLHGADA